MNDLEEALAVLFDFADRAFDRKSNGAYRARQAPSLTGIAKRIDKLKEKHGDPRHTAARKAEGPQAGAEEKAE